MTWHFLTAIILRDSKISAMLSFSAEAHTTSVTHAVHSFHPSTVCHLLLQYLSLSPPLSLHMSPSRSGEDRRGTGRQLMMKYDPVICGLSAVEDVRGRESSDVQWEAATDGRGLFFFSLSFPHCITSTWTIHRGSCAGEADMLKSVWCIERHTSWEKKIGLFHVLIGTTYIFFVDIQFLHLLF